MGLKEVGTGKPQRGLSYFTANTQRHYQSEPSLNEIALEVCQFLYSNDTAAQGYVLEKWFERDSTFEDPIVSLTGIKSIRNNFILFSQFQKTVCQVNLMGKAQSPEEYCKVSNGEMQEAAPLYQVLLVDSVHEWTLPLIPYKVIFPIYSRIIFNEKNRIVSIKDSWNVLHLIEIIPVFGWLYANLFRVWVGIATDKVVSVFC